MAKVMWTMKTRTKTTYDEGESEIEGSRLSDVGWMMVKVDSLIPETYATLIKGFMWDNIYCRPPQVMER